MIIICKGTKKEGRIYPCDFLYVGQWGDEKLIEHEEFHESDPRVFWLGYEITQFIGKYSGRDGKRE